MTKRILFDLYTPQHFIGGAGEYVRKVFYTLLDYLKQSAQTQEWEVLGLIDSGSKRFAYADLTPDALVQRGVTVVDACGKDLSAILAACCADCVFIGAAQYWGARFDLSAIRGRVVCVAHDLADEEYTGSRIQDYLLLDHKYRLLHFWCGQAYRAWRGQDDVTSRMASVVALINNNPQSTLVTVSEYSRSTLAYHYDLPQERIRVLYSPARVDGYSEQQEVENAALREVLVSGKPYYLLLNANRSSKNPEKTIRAFRRFRQTTGRDVLLVTVGYAASRFEGHVVLPFLSASDLSQVMRHAYAMLFTSFFEGFGYPPVEAMRLGKPVISSNVTSMPEILGNAPLYCSPLYESDIYRALTLLTDETYELYAEASRQRYAEVAQRQQHDLDTLIHLLIGGA